jgi:hypothetical protein
MYQPSTIDHWVLVIYETRGRFRKEVAERMVTELMKCGENVGKDIQTNSNAASGTDVQ